jgi:circadian clock protein KaiB
VTAPSDQPPGGNGTPAAARADAPYVLTLYIAGPSVRSERAVASLRGICERLPGRCELTIVDVLERPQLAERHRILATPTVIRESPLPRRRIIGDLSDVAAVVLKLDLPPVAADAEAEATP